MLRILQTLNAGFSKAFFTGTKAHTNRVLEMAQLTACKKNRIIKTRFSGLGAEQRTNASSIPYRRYSPRLYAFIR
jgi:hypothetical protein